MDQVTGISISVKMDTSDARREVEEFRRYALGVIDEIRAAYAAVQSIAPTGGSGDAATARRV